MKRLVFAAMLLLPTAAHAECDKEATSYAVQFKLYDAVGQDLWTITDFSNKELGDRHWQLRRLKKWARSLPAGCYRTQWDEWLDGMLDATSKEDHDRKRPKARPQTAPRSEAQMQAAGHALADKLPSPPEFK